VPMQTCGLHIKEVDRIDFFGISKDGSMEMPGREKIPDLTVFHVASLLFSEDVIREGLRDHSGTPVPPLPEEWPITARLQREVYGVVDRSLPRFDQLRSMVDYLRDEYVVDLESSDETSSLSTFIDQRSGGSHLFATAAALMARELGFRSRLVKGFYVRPGSFDLAAGHADILPGDIHFWTEIQLEDGRWFEIEPTPGFRQPNYKPSLRLLAMQFLSRYWLAGTGISLALVAAWFSRRIWCNALLALIWKLSAGLGGRRRLRLAMTIIESRAKLAGAARPSGVSQRAWLQTIGARDPTIGDAARQFCDVADSVFFGSKNDVPSSATRLVELLPLRIFIQLEKGAPS
ncbi:MAG: transglutaminase-like domain-containing protein, partial [Planctomycetota bacterium]